MIAMAASQSQKKYTTIRLNRILAARTIGESFRQKYRSFLLDETQLMWTDPFEELF